MSKKTDIWIVAEMLIKRDEGKSYQQIANELGVSKATVGKYLKMAKTKINDKGITALGIEFSNEWDTVEPTLFTSKTENLKQ